MKIIIVSVLAVLVLLVGYVALSPSSNEGANEISSTGGSRIGDSLTDKGDNNNEGEGDELAEVVEIDEPEQEVQGTSSVVSQGIFKERAHSVGGSASIVKEGSGHVLKFDEAFQTDNGPNLHIYLSSSLGESDFVDLGPLKSTSGAAEYSIPAGTDLDKYDNVLVWCVPFRVLFSYAELS